MTMCSNIGNSNRHASRPRLVLKVSATALLAACDQCRTYAGPRLEYPRRRGPGVDGMDCPRPMGKAESVSIKNVAKHRRLCDIVLRPVSSPPILVPLLYRLTPYAFSTGTPSLAFEYRRPDRQTTRSHASYPTLRVPRKQRNEPTVLMIAAMIVLWGGVKQDRVHPFLLRPFICRGFARAF